MSWSDWITPDPLFVRTSDLPDRPSADFPGYSQRDSLHFVDAAGTSDSVLLADDDSSVQAQAYSRLDIGGYNLVPLGYFSMKDAVWATTYDSPSPFTHMSRIFEVELLIRAFDFRGWQDYRADAFDLGLDSGTELEYDPDGVSEIVAGGRLKAAPAGAVAAATSGEPDDDWDPSGYTNEVQVRLVEGLAVPPYVDALTVPDDYPMFSSSLSGHDAGTTVMTLAQTGATGPASQDIEVDLSPGVFDGSDGGTYLDLLLWNTAASAEPAWPGLHRELTMGFRPNLTAYINVQLPNYRIQVPDETTPTWPLRQRQRTGDPWPIRSRQRHW